MEGFKSSENVEKDQADARMLTEQIKAHMTATMRTPLVVQDMTGINDGKPINLGFKLSQEMIEKTREVETKL